MEPSPVVVDPRWTQTSLLPMRAAAFADYAAHSAAAFAEDNVRSGRWPAFQALERAQRDFADSLPQGLATADNFLFEIVVAKTVTPGLDIADTLEVSAPGTGEVSVGILWFAVVEKHGIAQAFVYDLEIDPAFRRQGYARFAFHALEELVAARGITQIGLHVFAHNVAAQALYRSLGYDVTSHNMLKHLGATA
jgi:ribosomal protein S18 acetylase RimI-like enzyme